jgi:hypothetical protein
MAARLMRSARADGVYAGVLSTLTGGVVRLPRKFQGSEEIIRILDIGNKADDTVSVRSVFDEMCPPQELALILADGKELGIGVGELLPVRGRSYPVFCRLPPDNLRFRWNENRWYYLSIAGALPVTPGDGRWVLHVPGGRISPWYSGIWRAVARAYIAKDHARLDKNAYSSKLAHPARVAIMPAGSTEAQDQAWWQAVMAWGRNTVFAARPGYDVKLLESNGRGYECFDTTCVQSDRELIIAVAGQVGTTEGGAGFTSKDLFEAVRSDIIYEVATSLAYTINTQILPSWLVGLRGASAVADLAVLSYDTSKPKERVNLANMLISAAAAARALREELAMYGLGVDIRALCTAYDIPLLEHSAVLSLDVGKGAKNAEIA